MDIDGELSSWWGWAVRNYLFRLAPKGIEVAGSFVAIVFVVAGQNLIGGSV